MKVRKSVDSGVGKALEAYRGSTNHVPPTDAARMGVWVGSMGDQKRSRAAVSALMKAQKCLRRRLSKPILVKLRLDEAVP